MAAQEDAQAEMTLKSQQEAFANSTFPNFDDLQAEVENTHKEFWNKPRPIFNAGSLGYMLETLKSTSKASDLRLLGNEKSKDGLDEEALQLYTQSIAFAGNESEELALAYANRSALQFRSGRFLECLLDINRALQGKYPKTRRAKLEGRKEKCLVEIRRLSEEKPQFKLIQGNETDPIDAMKDPADDDEWRQMCKFGNPLIPSASPKIKLEYDEYWGRHVVATENIEPGEILSCQKYFIFSLQPEAEYENCSYCLLRCYALVPCSLCTEMYCSKGCRLRAKGSYHYMECKVIRSQTMSYSEWIPTLSSKMVRTLLVGTKQGTLLKSLMETMKVRDIFVENSDVRNKPFVDDYLSVLRVCRTFNASTLKDGVFSVLGLVATLQSVGFFESATKDDPAISSETDENCLNEKQLFVAMLLLNHLNTHANLFIISVLSDLLKLGSPSSLRSVGMGFCTLHRMLSHSCNPNSFFFTRERQSVVSAVRPIRKGEQIFISYCGNFGDRTREVRQKELIFYGVVCQCEACVNNWPLITDLKERKTGILKKKRMSARYSKQIRPFLERIIEARNASNLSNGELRHFVCKLIKFLHANVSSPSYLISACETQLVVLTILLYNESSRELMNTSQVHGTLTLIMNYLADESPH